MLLYRMEAKPWFRTARIGLVELTEQFVPKQETNRLLDLKSSKGKLFAEDPRWVRFGPSWLIAYTDSSEVLMASLSRNLEIMDSWTLKRPYNPVKWSPEKNWAVFEHNEELHAVYRICPHSIVKIVGSNVTPEHSTSEHTKDGIHTSFWKYGHPRGGASPVLHKGKWFHFFHSSVIHDNPGFNRNGKVKQYHCGLYVFNDVPPFSVCAKTKEPIILYTFPNEFEKDRPSQHNVVFPCGATRALSDDGWIISYGVNDYRLRITYVSDESIDRITESI